MNILATLRARFATAIASLTQDGITELTEMVKPSQDARFGDYQANCAMPMAKRLGQPPRDVAARILDALDVSDLCQEPEIAGPGFINLAIRDEWLTEQVNLAARDPRLGIAATDAPKTYVIDYSAPNVAKPMHVGHIRSTVIGAALARTLSFVGHKVITDNHIGDWGTQFGMIIYGYKHFADPTSPQQDSVDELARLYRLVNQLVQYRKDVAGLAVTEEKAESLADLLQAARSAPASGDKKEEKKAAKSLRRLESQVADANKQLETVRQRIESVQQDPDLGPLAEQHPDIDQAVLRETALLHSDDETNRGLWKRFLPPCMEDIERIYQRLGVVFDRTLGESFYHDRLADVVADMKEKQLATISDGAVCVFADGQDVPMIIQKKDGAFLYATTDLATIQYRQETWQPDAILYVVDHRQSLHFQQLFDAARRWGYESTELQHIKFGTVLGDDGRPFKTRSGSTVGLDGLLDEAVQRAYQVVSDNDDSKPEAELSGEDRRSVAGTVGIAALKYADLSQNRESDYVFSYDKMLALNGNTATYMQYAYARIRNIFAKGGFAADDLSNDDLSNDDLSNSATQIQLDAPAERALGVALLQLSEAIEQSVDDYRPNHLTNYLFELANRFSSFYNDCPVLKADNDAQRQSRLFLCDLTARTLKTGLSLLGIDVVEKM